MRAFGQISPWSIYPAQQPLAAIQQSIQVTSPSSIQLSNDKKSKKLHKAQKMPQLNRAFSSLEKEYQPKQAKISQSSLQLYSRIVTTPSEMIELKQQVCQMNEKYVILVAIKQCLKEEKDNGNFDEARHKLLSLFPILRPRESPQLKKYRMLRMEYTSQLLAQNQHIQLKLPNFL